MATMTEGPPPPKRSRGSDGGAVIPYQQQQQPTTALRSSSLPSPTMQLTGHTGSVYAVEYSPSGQTLLSTSFDKKCLLWSHGSGVDAEDQGDIVANSGSGNYENYNVLLGHKNAVLDCAWMDEEHVATASADKTVQLWDVLTGTRLRKWQEHTGIVNAVSSSSNNMVVSVSDDGSCIHWDGRQKQSVGRMQTDYPILAVAAGTDGNHVYTAGIDHQITCWDVGMQRPVYGMKGHGDTVTSLAMNHAGTHLLSNSMDQTVRQWDIQSFVGGGGKNRLVKTYTGHKHNAERGLLKCSWSPTGNMISAGSADKMVHIWDEFSTEELYLLPGHKGCVNAVAFHPTENVIASAGSDKKIFVGELS
jgi:Prp8 binding protein